MSPAEHQQLYYRADDKLMFFGVRRRDTLSRTVWLMGHEILNNSCEREQQTRTKKAKALPSLVPWTITTENINQALTLVSPVQIPVPVPCAKAPGSEHPMPAGFPANLFSSLFGIPSNNPICSFPPPLLHNLAQANIPYPTVFSLS
jgi:hypothetical protein